ncbi:LolA family protein [Bacillus changyiensis]|uniref:LolA family protein n=1 Tax=Bacillus changyiensis TaxID=3004103 RepID=UPI0022E575C0|nr:outer membrane lipoprotein carrier protein LolA [Bacillus changyiensis]MDA1477789.1 outer membrane lipoprotein carrier protein LolA [Bacillus changyiensis]
MKKVRKSFVLLLTGLLVVFMLSACGQKSQEDIVTGLDKKAKEYTSYKAKAKMTIETGTEPQVYNVEIWHKKPSFYRVYLENPKKDQSQVILRNENGVFVLTPSLNKSFRFHSDWPNNSSQVYLFESLVKDIKNDGEANFLTKDSKYMFETKTNYQHNQMLPTQEIVFNKKNLTPSSVKVMDTDRKAMVTVEFKSFEFDKPLDKSSFDEKKNMTLSQIDVTTSAEPSESFAVKTPLDLPQGVKKLEEKEMTTDDGKRIVITYGGEKTFTLIQEKARVAKTSASVSMSGEPVNLGFTVGVLQEKSLSWTYDGVDYLLSSEDLSQNELLMVAKSMQGQSSK